MTGKFWSMLAAWTMAACCMYAQDLAGYQKLRGDVLTADTHKEALAEAYKAFDTNEQSIYKSQNTKGWVGLDLKESLPIRAIRVYPRADKTDRMMGCRFEGSNSANFSNAVTLATVNVRPAADQYAEYNVTAEGSFRYVRCVATNDHCNLAELEFYSDEGKQKRTYKQLTNLPTIYVETGGTLDFVSKAEYANCKVIVAENGVEIESEGGIRGRGNSTWGLDKKAFRIKFNNKQHLLGLPANAKSWTLIASHVDKTFLRNGVTFEMSRFLEFEFTPACVHVDVVIDGFHYGTFFVSDQLQINKNRIDIDEMKSTDVDPVSITGGYHLEVDGYAHEEPVWFSTPRGVNITVKSPDEETIVPEQYNYIKNHVAAMEKMLYDNPEKIFDTYLDLKTTVAYYLLSELTGNCDSYWCLHLYKKRSDDKLYFGPVWDYDQAYLNDGRVPRYSPTLEVNFGYKQWFPRIMETEAARQELARQWKKVQEGNLKELMLEYIAENSEYLQQSQTLNYKRWNSLNKRIFTNIVSFETYPEYIDYLVQFIEDRFAWYDDYVKPFTQKKIHLLPASRPQNEKLSWKFTTSSSVPSNWYEESFDTGSWITGEAPFGTIDHWTTRWENDVIHIRRTFDVSAETLKAIDKLYLDIYYDEDCWVYINGKLALHRTGYLTNYGSYEIDNTLLKAGTNTIAIKCMQTGGGQFIDAGVFGVENSTTGTPTLNASAPACTVNEGVVTVSGVKAGSNISVYSMDGKLVGGQRAEGTSLQIALPGKGIYMVKTDAKVFKVIH